MRIPERYRLLVAALSSVVVVALVAGTMAILSGSAQSASDGSSTSTTAASSSSSSTPDVATPEGAVRAFFEGFAKARRTDDAGLIRPFVTGEESSAYISIQSFLAGQKAVRKASVLTIQRLENISIQRTDSSATVRLVYTEGGYDIALDTAQPLESPNVLAPRDVTLDLCEIGGRWLVESYEALSR